MTDQGVAGQQEDGATDDLKLALGKLADVIQGRPNARDDLLAILSAHLDGPPGPDTWDKLSQALLSYFEADAGPVLLWVFEAPGERVPTANGVATKEVAYLLDSATALYGPRLESASQANGQIPDDWALVRRHIVNYQGEGRVALRLEITKYNGDVALLECNPNSLANLCRWFITYLGYVGDGSSYTEDTLTGLREAMTAFEATLKPTDAGQTSETGASVGDEAKEPAST